tara:strand:+ start:1016 stop:1579 length:564 start_codon:yes stop_codon:yes gene_type:complete
MNFTINETGITNLLSNNEDYTLIKSYPESELSETETNDTDVEENDIPTVSNKPDPLVKYSKLLSSFSSGENTESGVGKPINLDTNNGLVNNSCINIHSNFHETDFSQNSPTFNKWDHAEEKGKEDILNEPNPSGFGGNTKRVNRRLNKTIEYVYDFQEYAPDTMVREDHTEPHLITGLLKETGYSLL